MKRAAIGLWVIMCLVTVAVAQEPPAAKAVAKAMVAVEAGDWDLAHTEVAPAGQVGRDIVSWNRLRAGAGDFAAYQEFLQRRSDWPGLPLLRAKGERAIPMTAQPGAVIAYFADQPPQTGIGALRLIAALKSAGKSAAAEAEAVRAWTELSLSEADQVEFLSHYGSLLKKYHGARQDMLLWRGKTTEAARLDAMVSPGQQALAAARAGLMNKVNGVDALVTAVPKALMDDPGLAHARFTWRARKGLTARSIELIQKHSSSAAALGRPEEWADRRRRLAREMMRAGKPKLAYQLANGHFLTSGDDYADLEWLAGFIALSDLDDPATALRHFQRFRVAVDTPISLGRAGYWEGRAYEALGQTEDAQAAYEFGGEYQTSFYGQLAAEKAGLAMDPALTGRESYADFKATAHAQSSVFQAALLFHGAGQPLLFTRFTRHLAESLTPAERGSLAQLALDLNQPFAAVYLAKYAADHGTVLMRPYFPVTDIVDRDLPVAKELTLAIARRESEFYAASQSPVGARGLMQLMPKTGQAMAQKLGLPFELDRLIDDPTYNATLGSAYLAQLIDEFGPALPLVAAGYNAGPSRPRRWSETYGDPRSNSVDAVDWIEHIPFRETRNYVMRVMESLPVYRARLSGKTGPLRLSEELKGR